MVPRESSPVATFIPLFDVRDEQSIDVAAPSDLVFAVARHADLMAHPLVSAIFRVRGFVMGDRPRQRRATGLVAETLSLGWGVLHFRPGQAIVMGAIAQPWARDVTFSAVDPDRFAAFDAPDLVKIAWTLEVEPHDGRTRLRTETRVVATDPEARRKFRRYWFLVSPGIRMIRWLILRSVKREAERQHPLASVRARHAA
jgi:hypothetical protein